MPDSGQLMASGTQRRRGGGGKSGTPSVKQFHARIEFYGSFYHIWCGNLVFYRHSGDFCHTFLCFDYACGNIRHTECGNNSYTIDFHAVL